MSRKLHLFVTSDRPDPYLNSLAHCLLDEDISKVVFVHIVGLGEHGIQLGRPITRGFSARVARRVEVLLEHLASGEYTYFTKEGLGEAVNLKSEISDYSEAEAASAMQFYRNILERLPRLESTDVAYLDLRHYLQQATMSEETPLLDATAIGKEYIGDLVAASMAGKIESLFTFSVKPRIDFKRPWRSLIHELRKPTENGESRYNYVNMIGTPVFVQSTGDMIVKASALRAALLLAVAFFAMTAAIYFLLGIDHPLVEVLFVAGSSASIVSLGIVFISRKGKSRG